MPTLQLLFGIGAGFVLGYLAWTVAQRFIARYRSNAATARGSERSKIDPLGVVVVLAMALCGGYVTWRTADIQIIVAVLVVTTLLLIIVLVDYTVRRIPNEMVAALLVWAVAQVLWLGQPTPLSALIGFLVGGAVFFLLALIGRGAMGMGDVKLVAAEGAILGFPLVLHGMFWGIMLGGLAAVLLLITKRAGRKDSFAYGPYLALGAWIIYLAALNMLPWQHH